MNQDQDIVKTAYLMTENEPLWWDSALINHALSMGVGKGWLLRTSTTQVELTIEGYHVLFNDRRKLENKR